MRETVAIRWFLPAVVAFGIAPSGAAEAGFVTHTKVEAFGSGSGTQSVYYEEQRIGANSASIGPLTGSGSGNGTQRVTSTVESEPVGSSLIRLSATADSDRSGGFVPPALSVTSAAWRDIIYYEGEGQRPDRMRLHFVLDGGLTAQALGNSGSDAAVASVGISFNEREDLVTYGRLFPGAGSLDVFASLSDRGTAGRTFETGGFNDFIGDAASFAADFFYDVPYDQAYGGYFWNLSILTMARSSNGMAVSNFGQTMAITGVGLTDGTLLSLDDISFDSGLRIQTVPEPSSAAMALLGLSGIVACVRLRAGVAGLIGSGEPGPL